MRIFKNEEASYRLKVFEDTKDFSVRKSFEEAIQKTFASDYVRMCAPWFILALIIHIAAPLIFSTIYFIIEIIASFFIMASVSVSWYKALAFQEHTKALTFGKNEKAFVIYSIAMGFSLVVAGALIFLVGTTMGASFLSLMIVVAFCLWGAPFFCVFIGLIAMGFDDKRTLSFVFHMVKPVHSELFFGYLALFIFELCVSLGVATLMLGWMNIIVFGIIALTLRFLFTGILVTFTSHVIYTRCAFERSE
ncbi:MAG: hypothetical protein K2X98_03240 [Alphaproteobacteria bacterium]|nr:hypothetical protein [Alphaproteobacteria bacterium]